MRYSIVTLASILFALVVLPLHLNASENYLSLAADSPPAFSYADAFSVRENITALAVYKLTNSDSGSLPDKAVTKSIHGKREANWILTDPCLRSILFTPMIDGPFVARDNCERSITEHPKI